MPQYVVQTFGGRHMFIQREDKFVSARGRVECQLKFDEVHV